MNRKSIILFSMVFAVALLPLKSWGESHKEMETGGMKYIKRSQPAWKNQGRIIGELENPPDKLTIEFYSVSMGKKIYTYTAPGKLNVYMSKFLAPGTYKLIFKSPGYSDFTVNSVKVQRGADFVLNIKLGRKVFVNR